MISDFHAPAAGTYYVRIVGNGATYQLAVTRNASLDTEPNNEQANAQPIRAAALISGQQTVLEYVEPSGGSDYYSVSVNTGDVLLISTATPAGGPNQFANTLDPKIELYDPNGMLVASDDNSAPMAGMRS